jgi:hypothetical protein
LTTCYWLLLAITCWLTGEDFSCWGTPGKGRGMVILSRYVHSHDAGVHFVVFPHRLAYPEEFCLVDLGKFRWGEAGDDFLQVFLPIRGLWVGSQQATRLTTLKSHFRLEPLKEALRSAWVVPGSNQVESGQPVGSLLDGAA